MIFSLDLLFSDGALLTFFSPILSSLEALELFVTSKVWTL